MKKTMKNLVSDTSERGLVIYPEAAKSIFLPYYRKEIDFTVERDANDFIKSCETEIRISDEYKAYKNHLIKDIPGMRNCALYSNLSIDDVPIEMHHGPIFNLYDYVEITIVYFFRFSKRNISTFAISDQILEDHKDHLIQTIMLSEMAHSAVHPRKNNVTPEFLSLDAAFGDLTAYINKYKDSISYKHLMKIKSYLIKYEEKKKNKSDSFNILKESIMSFKDIHPR
jgi:hypothetical protein